MTTIEHPRLQALVYGSVLALIVGWLLLIGKSIFVPIVLGGLVVYVIVGITRLLANVPFVGPVLPLQLRYALSIFVGMAAMASIALVILANIDAVAAAVPRYQATLLATIQNLAVRMGVEDEPTWATLRQVFLEQINVQSLLGTTFSVATSIVASAIVVFLYVAFLLLEQRRLPGKINRILTDAVAAARLQQLLTSINARIGKYLALKSFVCFLLGVVSWATMAYFGLEFALFLALLVALLNYVPYLGSFLGVALPVALAIVQFADMETVLGLLVTLTVVQFVIGNVLDPWLLGNSLNLSPFAILASLTAWTGLWGIPGAFLAVPITAIMVIVLSEFSGTRPIAILLSQSGDLPEHAPPDSRGK